MFDIGGWELGMIALVAIVVLGPDEIPGALRTFGRIVRRVRILSNDLRAQFDDLVREAELDDLRRGVDAVRNADLGKIVEDAVDPDRDLRDAMAPTAEPSAAEEPLSEAAPEAKAGPKARSKARPGAKAAAKSKSTKPKPRAKPRAKANMPPPDPEAPETPRGEAEP